MKERVKLSLLWLIRAAGGFALARWLTRDAVMIVGWHGVSAGREHERFPSLFISPEAFRQRLAFLKKHYTVVDLDTVVRQHAQGRFEPRQVVLTFDDGMQNFLDVAVPLLHEYGMTATNYVVSGYLDSRAPNHRMAVRDLLRRVRGPFPSRLPRGTSVPQGARLLAVEALTLKEFDALPPGLDEQAAYVTALTELLHVDASDLERVRTWYSMTPDVLHRLAQDGFSMQLHSHTHINVVDYPDSVSEQVRLCRRRVEQATGMPALHFCYPRGRWTRATWVKLEREGILTATTTLGGPNFPDSPLLALRRVMNGEDRGQLEFEFKMSNVHWLLASLTGRAHHSTPSEKRDAYRDVGGDF